MISGSLTKTSNETSSVMLDARNFVKLMQQSDSTNRSSITSYDENYELPESIKYVISPNYHDEYGMQYTSYYFAKQNLLNSVVPNNNKIELEYRKDYSLGSDFIIESGTTLVIKGNNIVLNGHVLRIRGNVEVYGRSNICNGFIIVETTDGSKDVFTTKRYYINDNENLIQDPELSFNGVSIRCVDLNGSSVTFLRDTMGFPQNDEGVKETTIFGIIYNILFKAGNAPLKNYVNVLDWNVKQFLIGTFVLNVEETAEKTKSEIFKAFASAITNLNNGEGLKALFYKTENGVDTSNGLIESIVDLMFTKPDIFKPIRTLLATLDGKVAKFNNFVKFLRPTILKFNYCTYHDNLNINCGTADARRTFGYHDFVTDKYIEVEDGKSKISGVVVENTLFVSTALTPSNYGNTIFDLNSILNVKNCKFILYGAYEVIANNFTDDSDVKKYHTKTFENCRFDLYNTDKLLEIDGGNVIFRNCHIQHLVPCTEISPLILFRRYPNANSKKIRVCFENCQIIGDSVAGKDELFNEDYCKIIINKGTKSEDSNLYQTAELYINNIEIAKLTDSIDQTFADEDLYLYYSGNDVKSKTYYINAKQFNPFENDRLIAANQ